MPATLTPRKIQKQFNMLFEEVNSFIGNVYKKFSHTPKFLKSFMNSKHKRQTAKKKN